MPYLQVCLLRTGQMWSEGEGKTEEREVRGDAATSSIALMCSSAMPARESARERENKAGGGGKKESAQERENNGGGGGRNT
jgi:hypothetical protein